MDFPSGCFLWRGILQQIRYFFGSRSIFFLSVLCRLLPCFSPSSRFLSGIFCVLRMPLAVFYQPFRYFSVSEAFFSAGLVQAPAVFFPVIPIFIRHLLRFADAARRVFSSHIGILGFPERFFCRSCAGARRVFSPSSRFFIRNLLHFTDAAYRVFSSHSGILGFPELFFCLFCAGARRVFSPSSRFFSGIFCVLRMLPAVFLLAIPVFFGSRSIFSAGLVLPPAMFFPAIPALFPLFLPFPLMENLLLSCFCTDFLHGTDARAFARA